VLYLVGNCVNLYYFGEDFCLVHKYKSSNSCTNPKEVPKIRTTPPTITCASQKRS
jgi:hypothetical protein